MTEAQWLAWEDPCEMLTFLQGRGSNQRKLRLTVAATYRRVVEVYVRNHWRTIVELVEQWVDGKAHAADVARAAELYRGLCNYSQHNAEVYLASAVLHMTGAGESFRPDEAVRCCATAYGWAWNWNPLSEQMQREVETGTCAVVRDIFGNPFRPATLDPVWRTSTAVALAGQMYESRDFSAMPILADALQDAGCDSEDVLGHCRDPHATHVRGCWVVDLVLGKL
jgi:hypothetical protein